MCDTDLDCDYDNYEICVNGICTNENIMNQ